MIFENKEEYLTPKEIEKKLKLSHTTTSKLIHTPGFPMVKIGRNIRVKAGDLEEFLNDYKGHQIAL
jgi:excisionase family DNA binding protein